MTALRISWVDVFTDRPFAGNRLAVVLDADPLDAAGMQTLAAELNLPETTFVLDGVGRLRIFTPTTELPLAGHPVVGTTVELGRLGLLGDGDHVFRMGAGDTPVALHDGLATMTQPDLRVHRELDPALSASLLGLDPGDVTGRLVVCETAVPTATPSRGHARTSKPLRASTATARSALLPGATPAASSRCASSPRAWASRRIPPQGPPPVRLAPCA